MLTVGVDASKLISWAAELSARGLRNAIRRTVDQSARAARKLTIPIIAADIGGSSRKLHRPFRKSSRRRRVTCIVWTENLIRVDAVKELTKLAE